MKAAQIAIQWIGLEQRRRNLFSKWQSRKLELDYSFAHWKFARSFEFNAVTLFVYFFFFCVSLIITITRLLSFVLCGSWRIFRYVLYLEFAYGKLNQKSRIWRNGTDFSHTILYSESEVKRTHFQFLEAKFIK